MRALVMALLLAGWPVAPAVAQQASSQSAAGLEINVGASGQYQVRATAPEMLFAGDVGHPLTNIRASDGQDALGRFHQVDFDYLSGARSSGIRIYHSTPVVLFTTAYVTGGANTEPFPTLTILPRLPHSLAYHDTPFSPYQLNTLAEASDSPWLFFDNTGTGFLISPAANFLNARMTLSEAGALSSGIDNTSATLPAGYAHQTILTVGTGLNRMFDIWGAALTALRGKTRPANDADLTLNTFGYWTDNGATYYYHYDPPLGYAGTLLGVKHELEQRGIALGYLQLDSWWYPKGPNQLWDDRAGGIFRYRAAPDLFPNGLNSFRQQVGLPLVTHARWIDPTSPLRGEFAYSGNVMTDARYWSDVMTYLQAGGVVTYEQDWLGAQAQPVYDLSAPRQFMGNMADAAAQHGLTLQYCMPLPRHVLQTVEYGNVTSMRVSDDRFDRNRWDNFLYTSRLASALGVWPWSDVFFSTERNNLLLADLSAGVVGIGDALGTEDVGNIRKVMRADAVLVKPDAPIVPTDESMLAEATAGSGAVPMVAWTYSDHGADMRNLYVFAYGRGDSAQTASFWPAAFGLSGPAFVYDAFADRGVSLAAGETYAASVSSGSYFIVVPVGASGIAFLGDRGEFASLGQKRISRLADDGTLRATIEFAAGEQSVTLHGSAPKSPDVSVNGGSADSVAFDPETMHFVVDIHPRTAPSGVEVTLNVAP